MMGSLHVLSGSWLAIGKEKLDSKGIFDDNLQRRQCTSGAQGEENWNRRGSPAAFRSRLGFDDELRVLVGLLGRGFFRPAGRIFLEEIRHLQS